MSLSPCDSVQCTHSSCICTVPDVMVGVIAGKMSWPAVTVRKDVGDFLQENKISSTLTFFNFNFFKLLLSPSYFFKVCDMIMMVT